MTTRGTANVKNVGVDEIAPNPHNPRRLFDEEPMRILKESVEKLGILVPVTVYEAPPSHRPKSEHYILLDGERRWRCARELSHPTVPAIVVEEPDETQNMLTMFHIHNVREGWQLMPTALKLDTLMKELKETNERNLTELTKLSISQIRRCKILLTYPHKYQSLMLAPVSERMKADFFIELDRIRRPARDDAFVPWVSRGDSKSIGIMLDKYETKVIKAVTDFRDLAVIYRAAIDRGKKRRLESEFEKFMSNPEMAIEQINIPEATFAKGTKEANRSARRLLTQLGDLRGEVLATDQQLILTLRQLERAIHHKLEDSLLIGPRDDESGSDSG